MEKSILSEFLNANLLSALRNDDDFKLIQTAADELGVTLLEKPSEIPHFVVAAVDSGVPGSDPTYEVVQKTAKSKWSTILNVIGPEPVQVYRGIVLGALEVVVFRRPEIIPAIILTAANVPETAFGSKEAEPIVKFLSRLKMEESFRVENVWVSNPEIAFPNASTKPRNVNIKADILNGLSKAAGPTNLKGEAVEGSNPTYATDTMEWTNYFVKTAGDTLFKAIQAGFDQNSAEIRDAAALLKAEFQKLITRDAKCELLWLKESQYSLSGKKSFREMTEAEVLFCSVLDVSEIVGYAAAPSIEWFLHSIVEARFPGRVEVKSAIEDISKLLQAAPELAKKVQLEVSAGRRTLLEIACARNPNVSFEVQSGLPDGFQETCPNLARRLFRELQSFKITTREH